MNQLIKKTKKDYLYEFTAKDKDGVEHKFSLTSPTRKFKSLGEDFYTETFSKLIRKGVLPRAVFQATIQNMGKTVSEAKEEQYQKDLDSWTEKCFELEQKRKAGASESDILIFEGEIAALKEKLVEYQINDFLVYQNTAEAKAQQKTITWFALNLAQEEVAGKYEPLFKGKDLDEKLDEYDDLSNDEFYVNVLRRIHYLVTIWFLNGIDDEKEFAELDKKNIQENLAQSEELLVEESVTEGAAVVDEVIAEETK